MRNIRNRKKDILIPDKNNVKKKTNIVHKNVYYTILGKHDYLDDKGYPIVDDKNSAEILAKYMPNSRQKYWVKCDTRNKLYNPYGMYSEGRLMQKNREKGRPEFKFMPVKQKVFNCYVEFLRTKFTPWINQAEREIV